MSKINVPARLYETRFGTGLNETLEREVLEKS
jgi:hypothetical protein